MCLHIRVYVPTYARICAYICAYMCLYMRVYVPIYARICAYICAYMCLHMRVYVPIHARICAYICAYKRAIFFCVQPWSPFPAPQALRLIVREDPHVKRCRCLYSFTLYMWWYMACNHYGHTWQSTTCVWWCDRYVMCVWWCDMCYGHTWQSTTCVW